LRVDREMELKGMDIVKHGEAAYPAQAWVELQYTADDKNGSRPSHMKGVEAKFGENGITFDPTVATQNNPMEMLPAAGTLFNGVTRVMSDKNLQLFERKDSEKVDPEKGVENPSFSE